MDINFPDISKLSINNNEYIQKINSESMEDLFINIYSYENPNISFEELIQKLIDYYYKEANYEYISKHLSILFDICDRKVISNIQKKVMDNNKLYMIIEFISSSYGKDYLHHIYHIFISPN
jgi:hypothetical protein